MISTILPDNLTTPLSYLHSPAPSLVNLTLNYTLNLTGDPVLLPGYLRVTSMALCIAIMALGVVGNVMVPLVIFNTKDMRNSTNIFLVNLSVADLMVLLVCTPTVLVEVNSRPETWVLGREMCKAVPFVELTVAHASVLTILAISFERYYAICKPLKAGYVCTKARASCICLLAWLVAALFTSPILAITYYGTEEYYDGSLVHVCFSLVDSLLPCLFFIISIVVFFVVPLGMLLCIYSLIARTLMAHPSAQTSKGVMHPAQSVIKYRRQVVVMLGAVVIAFFLCLLPFRALTLWIVVAPAGATITIGIENYYNILYFCRIMFYINSAINPILYNIMSSKFRGGFFRLCGARQLRRRWQQRAELLRKSTNSSSHNSSQQTSDTTSGSRGSSRSGSKRRPSLQHQSSLSSMQHQVSLPPLPRLEGVREVEVEGEGAFKVGDKGAARDFFIRAPLEVVNGINGQRMPAGEIYV